MLSTLTLVKLINYTSILRQMQLALYENVHLDLRLLKRSMFCLYLHFDASFNEIN